MDSCRWRSTASACTVTPGRSGTGSARRREPDAGRNLHPTVRPVATIQRWFPLGDDAVLVEFRDPADRWQVRCPPALETVVGATTVLLRFDPGRHSPSAVVDALTLVPVTDTGTREHDRRRLRRSGPGRRGGSVWADGHWVIRRHSEQPCPLRVLRLRSRLRPTCPASTRR